MKYTIKTIRPFFISVFSATIIFKPFFILSFTRYNRLIVAGAFILLSVLRFVQFFMDDFNYSEYVPYLQYL